jgi:hypothetical protein
MPTMRRMMEPCQGRGGGDDQRVFALVPRLVGGDRTVPVTRRQGHRVTWTLYTTGHCGR